MARKYQKYTPEFREEMATLVVEGQRAKLQLAGDLSVGERPKAMEARSVSNRPRLTVKDPEEAQRAERDLLESGVPDQDLRIYHAEETLRIASRIQEERSILAQGDRRAGGRPPGKRPLLEQRQSRRFRPLDLCPDQGPRRPTGRVACRLPLRVYALLRRRRCGRRPWGRQLTAPAWRTLGSRAGQALAHRDQSATGNRRAPSVPCGPSTTNAAAACSGSRHFLRSV